MSNEGAVDAAAAPRGFLNTFLAVVYWLSWTAAAALAYLGVTICDQCDGPDDHSFLVLSLLSWLAASAVITALFARVHTVFVVIAFACQLALAAAAVEITRLEPFGVTIAPGLIWAGVGAELLGAVAIACYRRRPI
jgi:hypothetical protein